MRTQERMRDMERGQNDRKAAMKGGKEGREWKFPELRVMLRFVLNKKYKRH